MQSDLFYRGFEAASERRDDNGVEDEAIEDAVGTSTKEPLINQTRRALPLQRTTGGRIIKRW